MSRVVSIDYYNNNLVSTIFLCVVLIFDNFYAYYLNNYTVLTYLMYKLHPLTVYYDLSKTFSLYILDNTTITCFDYDD